jgi:hypothetical protein
MRGTSVKELGQESSNGAGKSISGIFEMSYLWTSDPTQPNWWKVRHVEEVFGGLTHLVECDSFI